MTNENDINAVLREFNQKALLNKKKIDIENIVETILLFFNNYLTNISNDILFKVMDLKNISNDSPNKDIVDNLILSFANLIKNRLKEITTSKFKSIENKIPSLSDNECQKELSRISSGISNEMSDYYLENASDLVNELNRDNDNNNKLISDYILKIVYSRVMNTLKDRLMYSIKVIDNNNEENNQKLENINEKTIRKV